MTKTPTAKPSTAPASAKGGAKDTAAAALPDAALLDREGDGAETPAAPVDSRRNWLARGRLRWAAVGAGVLMLVAGAAGAGLMLTRDAPPSAMPAVISGPAQVINGRMLVVAGQTIRLQAIDAPPATLICRDGTWEYKCGAESRKALEALVGNRQVDCETAGRDDDAVHAVCHSDQGIDIAAALVASGWAVADLRHSSRYLPQQAKAQDQSLGLWRNNFAYPEQWRLAARGGR